MGVIGIIASVVSTVAQMSAQRKAAKAQREANAISGAGQSIQDAIGRRRAAREERIRRSRLISGASAAGAIGSAGLAGSLGALRSNSDQVVAEQTGQALAAQGISAANQRAADAESSIYRWRAFSQLVSTTVDYSNKIKQA